MKALILAGGFGTRLRPLSCTRPKLMFPVANRPLLDWALESLSKSGVDTVILAVNYMADVLERFFGRERYGMEIIYSREVKPLGTGGPIKKAEEFLKGEENFFVLNGDILSRIDYRSLHDFHVKNDGDGTIALHEVEDPSRFGAVELGKRNQILRFVEKPRAGESPSKLINAGVYILDRSVLELIPGDRKVSTETEVFPVIAQRRKLYGYEFEGLWIDIGMPNDYIQANRMMLGLMAEKPILREGAEIHGCAQLIPPVIIGEGVKVGEDAVIGPYASLGEGVEVGKGSRIQSSVIFPGVWVDRFASIKGAVVGENAIVGQWVKVEEGCIIGDHVVIDDDVTMVNGVQVCPSKEVRESVLEPGTIM